MKSKKEARCVHKERIILLWVVFAAVLLFVLASPNNIFEYQKIDLIQESFATLIGPGNLLTGAVIGVQDFSIQAEFSSQLGDFIEPFSGTSINETRWNYTNDNGASDISWNEALYINLTPNGAGADEQDFRIQDEYLNLSTDFNVTFDANQSQNFPLTGTNYTFITVGIINNSEDGFVGSSCQYIWNATDMAISTNKGFSTQNRTAFVSSTNDNFSIEVSNNPTTLQFNCSGTVSGTRQSTEVDTNIFTTDAKNLTFGFQVGT
ncbi:hypothetical protein HQ489_03010, partial [Candidatus Woesearchaeota archaeon]|nr:hypothetical protein [Candidatus Woesearchaeota archaeon]